MKQGWLFMMQVVDSPERATLLTAAPAQITAGQNTLCTLAATVSHCRCKAPHMLLSGTHRSHSQTALGGRQVAHGSLKVRA
jgi:hypothetical protein